MPRSDNCRFVGRHRTRLVLAEECRDCGHRRDLRTVSAWGVRTMPWALWLIALLLLAALF